jgi:hypothetical protein
MKSVISNVEWRTASYWNRCSEGLVSGGRERGSARKQRIPSGDEYDGSRHGEMVQ